MNVVNQGLPCLIKISCYLKCCILILAFCKGKLFSPCHVKFGFSFNLFTLKYLEHFMPFKWDFVIVTYLGRLGGSFFTFFLPPFFVPFFFFLFFPLVLFFIAFSKNLITLKKQFQRGRLSWGSCTSDTHSMPLPKQALHLNTKGGRLPVGNKGWGPD